jgi:putative ATP-dependent endonuclease of the OLD family
MARMIQDLETRHPELKGRIKAEDIRDLYSHAYNPRRNEGFFASKIILVEGLTEEYSLPIYADALPGCSFDPQGISVVECGGKGSMDRIYRMFNELHIPCYILFDYDDGNPEANIIKKSKELLELVGLPVDAPQSLFVGDCIACFPRKWETDLRDEIPDAEALAAAARNALGNGIGKPLIARYMARQLTACTSPYVPPSLKAIIEKAVTVIWTKSCLAGTAAAHSGETAQE